VESLRLGHSRGKMVLFKRETKLDRRKKVVKFIPVLKEPRNIWNLIPLSTIISNGCYKNVPFYQNKHFNRCEI
jgi:hypothetical protein